MPKKKANADQNRHSKLDWVGGEFDPEAFDLEAANEELQAVG